MGWMLIGRAREQRAIAALLDAASAGTSGTLVVVGEPGIGKTALLEHAAAAADGFQLVRARGIASEAELAFGGLFGVCRPLLDRLDRLEPQQADALRGAFGLHAKSPPTPFAIGAATLALLASAAEDRPLLLLVDDAHWLDRGSADALVFAVRRLQADAVAALFATRPGEGRPFSQRDLPELEVEPLDDGSAATLLGDAVPAESRRSILRVASGNPLALLELPRELEAGEGLGEPLRVGKHLERAFASRAAALRDDTRLALVLAAATTDDESEILRNALGEVGLTLEALVAAESIGLISVRGGTFEFRHPLIRSALYHAADPADRRRAHAALAAALGGDDRAAWHRAAAAVGPDDDVAAALERAAENATTRSGFAAAAAAYERAARLSEQRGDRLRRLTQAADAAWLAGRTPQARALIDEALAHTDERRARGELLHTRGTIEHFVGDVVGSRRTLEEAAELLQGEDRKKACMSFNAAVGSALMAGEIERAVALSERAHAIADPHDPDHQLFVLLSRGASLLMVGRPEEGLPFLERAARAFERGGLLADDPRQISWAAVANDPRHLSWAALAAFWLGDGELMTAKASAAVEWAREHAAFATLPFAARLLARGHLILGAWPAARAALAESLETARISDQALQEAETLATLAWLDAVQGRAEDCRRRVERALAIADRYDLRWRNGFLQPLVLLELGLGAGDDSEDDAVLRAWLAGGRLRDTPANSTLPDVVEALFDGATFPRQRIFSSRSPTRWNGSGSRTPGRSPSAAVRSLRTTRPSKGSSSTRSSSTRSIRTSSPRRERTSRTASGFGGSVVASARARVSARRSWSSSASRPSRGRTARGPSSERRVSGCAAAIRRPRRS